MQKTKNNSRKKGLTPKKMVWHNAALYCYQKNGIEGLTQRKRLIMSKRKCISGMNGQSLL